MANDFSKITIDGTTYNVKVPNKLTVGSKTFDGSSAVTIAASDLGLSNALQFIGETTETPLSDGSTTSSVKIGSTTHTAATGDVVLYGAKEFVWQGSMWKELGDGSSHALKTISISAGSGLTGGGTLEANRTISHADTSSQASISASGRRYITGVTLDGYGHVTGLTTGTETVTAPTTPSEVGAAPKKAGVYLVKGNTTGTAGTWTGTSSDFTDYYDGLVVAYDIGIAGATTTTLNINGNGAKTVYLRGTTKLTTHYAVGTIILLVYSADADAWYKSDYDSNGNTTIRVYRQDASGYNKDYPLIASRTVAADLGTVGTESSYEAVYGLISDTNANIPTTNPYTGESKFKTVTATTFNGDLSGNATTATTADNATKLGGQAASYYAAAGSVLEKTTYEKSAELACGSNGLVCLGKFGAYDTNITIELNSTTSQTYHATIVIWSQNVVANGTGGAVGCYVYGDADNHITPLITVFRPYGSASRQIEVYASLSGWSKNLVHVQCVALSDGGMTDVLTSVSSIPTSIDGKIKVTPINVLKENFASKDEATTSAAGLMSAADKTKLDSTYGANAITSLYVSNGDTSATSINDTGIQCSINEIEIEMNGGDSYNYCSGQFEVPIVAGQNVTIVSNQDNMAEISATDTTYSAGNGLSLSGTTFSWPLADRIFAGTGSQSVSIGKNDNTVDSDYSIAIGSGNSITNSFYSVALGEGNTITSSDSTAIGDGNTITSSYGIAAGDGNTASGTASVAMGYNNTASGDRSVAAGGSNEATGDYAVALGYSNIALGNGSVAIGYNNETTATYATAMGYGNYAGRFQTVVGRRATNTAGPTTITDKTGNLFVVGNGTGTSARTNAFRVTAAGAVYGLSSYSSSGADYAEMWEWADGNPNNEDRRGKFVTVDENNKIRIATADDEYILGIISATPCVVGDVQSENWREMYLKDVFGQLIVKKVDVPEHIDEETGELVKAHTEEQWVLNPEYDPTRPYVSRDERKEWAAVGLMGKLVVIDDGTCVAGRYCKLTGNGTATASTDKNDWRVLKRMDSTHVQILYR